MTKCLLAIAATAAALAQAQTTYTESILRNFGVDSQLRGENPASPLIRDPAGNLYGTAAGGSWASGVIFKVSPSGQETVLHSFAGGAAGSGPVGIVGDGQGNFYGATATGGAGVIPGCGVVFKFDASGQETVLYTFTSSPDGCNPSASVIRDSAGNLYGVTTDGGAYDQGAVYKLDSSGHETILYSFTGHADGGNPEAGLVLDQSGNLYGTTYNGGAVGHACSVPQGCGVVFQIDPSGDETVLYTFTGGPDGSNPAAPLILDAAGDLYGTTENGGTLQDGVVFALDRARTETVLHDFKGADGAHPQGGLLLDAAGNLYGTTNMGGNSQGLCIGVTCGTVFKLAPDGNETVLHSFVKTDGSFPLAGVTADPAGNLYGTTQTGGQTGRGVVFELNTAGQETVLYNFPTGKDPAGPESGVVFDAAGNLYGTTYGGGDTRCQGHSVDAGCGTVYKVDPTGQLTILHAFTGGSDGINPASGVVLDAAGNIYGTTTSGGSYNWGIVYKLDPSGQETVLFAFDVYPNGSTPSGLVLDAAGNLYGTAASGGMGSGLVFQLTPSGTYTILHTFNGGDGQTPIAGVVLDPAGNIYGTTQNGGTFSDGVIFKLDPAGNYSLLYTFTDKEDGRDPGALTRDAQGNLYGTTEFGRNELFKLDTAGNFTELYVFSTGPQGRPSFSALTLDAAGNFYGTAQNGGTSDSGIVFEVTPAGVETVLHNFSAAPDGRYPYAGVTFDAAGNLYGTTSQGGKLQEGTIFKLAPQ